MSAPSDPPYLAIVRHYEDCLRVHGDTHKGVDWPNAADARTRYGVMLDVIRPSPSEVTLLDFGCGTGHLYEYMLETGRTDIRYSGLELSPVFVEVCRTKFPGLRFDCVDLLADPDAVPAFDYVVLNGVLTEKQTLGFDEMFEYAQALLTRVFAKARIGIAFNVMSKHVDWEREDLFHVPFDILAPWLRKTLSPRFVFRNDYGLFEYTTYVYR